MAVREANLEDTALDRIAAHGAMAPKTEYIFPGFPDRTIFGPDRVVGLMELKRWTGKRSPAQTFCHAILARLGWKVHVPHNRAELEAALREIFGKRYIEP